jgi:PAS domain S-box-containing protein
MKGSVDKSPGFYETVIKLAPLLSNLRDGILVENENGEIIFLNQVFCNLFRISENPQVFSGTESGMMLSRTKSLFKKPAAFVALIKTTRQERKPCFGKQVELENGNIFSFDYLPVTFNGKYSGNLWKYTDITESKTTEDNLTRQKNFYEKILFNIPGSIAAFNSEHQYVFVNTESIKNPEIRKWIIGKNDDEYCRYTHKPQGLADTRKKMFVKMQQTGKSVNWEEQITTPDGIIEYHLREMYPVIDDKGNLEMAVGFGVNVTERKKIEDQVKLSEKRYKELFNFSQAWICTHDLNGKLLTINPAACKMLGYEEPELIGKKISSFLSPGLEEKFNENYLGRIRKEGSAEGVMVVYNKSGEKKYLLYQNYLLSETREEPYVIGFAQNITDRFDAEEALKRSEEKYRGIIENMNLGMLEMDTEEHIRFANQRFCAMSGYEPDELYGKKATDLFLENEEARSISDIARKRQYRLSNNYEFRIRTKKGETKWWLVSTAPLHNPDGSLKGAVSIHLDITRQKKMEGEMKIAIQDAERSSHAKEAFLANMSHEIRTPINAIMGLGKLLSKTSLDEQQRFYLSSVRTASENLLVIINDILDISKIEAGKIALEQIPFDINKTAQQAVNMLLPKAEEKGLVMAAEVDPGISTSLIGDPYRINQVLINMLSNAIKFTDKGYVHLKVALTETTGDIQKIGITIKDSGIGINEDFLNKIFNKFTQEDETIVRKFGGTGLGMSITRQLMELMGGSIDIKSRKNHGTTITLSLPLKIGTQRILEKKRAVKSDTSNISNKKILLVEDNELNRLLAYTILTQYGAQVTTAGNGAIAIEQMRKNNFDIVLMDVQMPVMDGVSATTIIRKEINTQIPIIALTANAIKGKKEQYLEAGMNDYITKPYDEEKMIAVIANWLHKSAKETVQPAPAIIETIAPPATPEEPLFDIKKLISIGGNNPDFVTQMLSLFVTDVPQSVQKIKEAYHNNDFKTVKYLAHRVRPSIINMCINSIKEETIQIEKLAEKGEQSPELESMIDKIVTTISIVSAKLKAEHNI